MKVDAKIIDSHYDFGLKGTTITFLAYGNLMPHLEEYLTHDISLDIKKDEKRSNNANGYLWVLLRRATKKAKDS